MKKRKEPASLPAKDQLPDTPHPDNYYLLQPEPTLVISLASLLVHIEEFLENARPERAEALYPGAFADLAAITGIVTDARIMLWRNRLKDAGLLPLKRSER